MDAYQWPFEIVIPQNLYISLGTAAALIPANLLGMRIGAAVLFQEGSTLFMVANVPRPLAYKEPTA